MRTLEKFLSILGGMLPGRDAEKYVWGVNEHKVKDNLILARKILEENGKLVPREDGQEFVDGNIHAAMLHYKDRADICEPGAKFEGTHGTGILSEDGLATNTDWLPLKNQYAFGGRGGSWRYHENHARIADRFKGLRTKPNRRAPHIGFRGVRSGP